MNFADIVEDSVKVEKVLTSIEEIIYELKECYQMHTEWYSYAFDFTLNYDFVGGTSSAQSNAADYRGRTIEYYKKLKSKLMSLDFMDYSIMVMEMSQIRDSDLEIYSNIFKEKYKIIHNFRCRADAKDISGDYILVIDAIRKIISSYEFLLLTTRKIYNINLQLNIGSEESNFNIRLLSENNKLDSTLESLSSIESLYNSVCSILNISTDNEPLKYTRMESGSMLAYLAGNAIALGIVVKILKFLYEVYKDQFSWKAKQERTLGEIKVRGEILKLIKEYNDMEIIIGEAELKNKLATIEENGTSLFKRNPSIILNGESLGISELKNEEISDKFFLELSIDKIEAEKNINKK